MLVLLLSVLTVLFVALLFGERKRLPRAALERRLNLLLGYFLFNSLHRDSAFH